MKVIGEEANCEEVRVVCSGTNSIYRGCGLILEIDPADIFRKTECGMDLNPEHYYAVSCPVCGAETKINIDLFPSSVKEAVDEKDNAYESDDPGYSFAYRP